MSNSIATERPADNYYLDYFLAMVTTVAHRYEDILSDDDRNFLQKLDRSSHQALRLLIRLYIRKGPNFIASKLNYAEIPDMTAALQELAAQSLIEFNPDVYAWELIDILPIALSRSLFLDGTDKIKKADLIDLWLDDEQLLPASEWGCPETIISPLDYDSLRRFQLLYFGNDRQTLTDFILEDLGVAKYECYPLDTENRLFTQTSDIEHYLLISDYNQECYLLEETKTWDNLISFASQCLALNVSERMSYRWHKLLNRIAYRLEQQQELDLALHLFSINDLPPARERRVRILHKQGQYQAALSLINEINKQPYSTNEVAFYQRFVNKIHKPLNLAPIKFSKPQWQEKHIQIHRQNKSVELMACDHFEHCLWLENALPMAIFGLVFWPVIFADVPGVWHHPFQSGPTDLLEENFVAKRKKTIDHIYHQEKHKLRESIIHLWKEKKTIANPFINWKLLTLETILTCFDALTLDQWHGIFKHLLTDIRHHRSGFPDLFQRTLHSYEFIEVKGPGDKLQDNQIAWLKVFNQLGIHVSVCYVSFYS